MTFTLTSRWQIERTSLQHGKRLMETKLDSLLTSEAQNSSIHAKHYYLSDVCTNAISADGEYFFYADEHIFDYAGEHILMRRWENPRKQMNPIRTGTVKMSRCRPKSVEPWENDQRTACAPPDSRRPAISFRSIQACMRAAESEITWNYFVETCHKERWRSNSPSPMSFWQVNGSSQYLRRITVQQWMAKSH